MDLDFKYGDKGNPRGHALVYFLSGSEVFASYIVVLPIELDMARYVPPFLAGQLKQFVSGEKARHFTIPPIPETVDDYEYILNLATARDDDLLFGGEMDSSDPTDAMGKLNAIGSSYSELCGTLDDAGDDAEIEIVDEPPAAAKRGSAARRSRGASGTNKEGAKSKFDSFSDEEKLRRLTELLGQLRFAVESVNKTQAGELKKQMLELAQTMPSTMKIKDLIKHGVSADASASRLAQLYLDRAYQMHKEDYLQVKAIEEKIAAIISKSSAAND